MIDSVQQEERSVGKEAQREAGETQDEGQDQIAHNRQGGCRGYADRGRWLSPSAGIYGWLVPGVRSGSPTG